ncbi:MAG: 2-C-methyl-D-erythritol 4-phosphate cytidylyltransferase [Melioribacteraceae bacterium]|nr:2-C-methyl-D-erythritol 4-phosphate cytidylyltransferase [Melioribacteraceae bacterium]MCF8353500.1 2-C-methyl-D-erythritol 4-phosphate cytidylyltransferase [Melioribacteraceae bacterium]MCF8392629.1 2-C-methyl-D-erythritol 4-phosphate cytidylyltransferase [Melioribacteraceae bacterium]MCF8418499.1 2-C-methyl-D-erythritol 4-phosphate cytidylyltransferase [Melioribacteraceae bacterium]
MKIYAIIPAGGSGKRTGKSIPKQYLKFNGQELIAYTLDIFQQNNLVDEIIIPAGKDYFEKLNSIKETFGLTKVSNIIEGGRERQNSVFNALSSLNAVDDDLIIVHDAVRPLLSQEILNNAIETAIEHRSVVVAIKAKDTLIKGTDMVNEYLSREEIYYAQTPQIFSFSILNAAMEKAVKENFPGTDESMLVKNAGYNVHLVEGSSLNFKVTTESDIDLLHLILKS